jgi:hypothetical protein
MKYKRLRLSTLDNSTPLFPVQLTIDKLLVEGSFIGFDIRPRLTCAKLDFLLSLHNPCFPQLAQPFAHIFNGLVVDM